MNIRDQNAIAWYVLLKIHLYQLKSECIYFAHILITYFLSLLELVQDPQIFRKSRSHLEIPGVRRVTLSKFHTEDPQILGTTCQNLVIQAAWHPEFVHLFSSCIHTVYVG
jgi:hypothetical protein